jgi:hypothetical protein
MRRFFAGLAAVGLLGGLVGCSSTGCTHGRCDCDDSYGCACCPAYGSPAGGEHGYGSGLGGMAGPGYVATPTSPPASTTPATPATPAAPASQGATTPK